MRSSIFWNFSITAAVAMIFSSLTVDAQNGSQESAGNKIYKDGPCEKDIPPVDQTRLEDHQIMRDLCWRDHISYTDREEGTRNLYGAAENSLHGVDVLVKDLHLTGSGIEAGIWDGGFVSPTHVEFQNPGGSSRVDIPVPPDPDLDGDVLLGAHATHVAGIMSAKGANYKAAGPASGATIHSYYFGLRSGVDTRRLADAAANGTVVSNHSYGRKRGWQYYRGGEDCWNSWHWMGDPTQ